MEETSNQLEQLERCKLLYRLVKMLARQEWLRISEEELTEIKEMKSLLEVLNPVNRSSRNQPLVLLFHFNTLALCQYMLHDTASGSVYSQKILYLWKTHPHLIEDNALLFLNALNTTCYNDLLCDDIPQVKENMSVYKLLVHLYLKDRDQRRHFEIIRFNTDLKLLHKAAQYDEIKALVDDQGEEMVSGVIELLPPPDALPIIGSVCISCFVLGRWDDAGLLLNKMKELNRRIDRLDISYFISLFYLLILYEKKERRAMNIAIKTSIHDLRSRNLLRPFEHKMMLFMKRMASADPAKAAELTAILISELNEFSKEEKQLYFLYFDYYGWLCSKMKGMRYMDYRKEMVAGD